MRFKVIFLTLSFVLQFTAISPCAVLRRARPFRFSGSIAINLLRVDDSETISDFDRDASRGIAVRPWLDDPKTLYLLYCDVPGSRIDAKIAFRPDCLTPGQTRQMIAIP